LKRLLFCAFLIALSACAHNTRSAGGENGNLSTNSGIACEAGEEAYYLSYQAGAYEIIRASQGGGESVAYRSAQGSPAPGYLQFFEEKLYFVEGEWLRWIAAGGDGGGETLLGAGDWRIAYAGGGYLCFYNAAYENTSNRLIAYRLNASGDLTQLALPQAPASDSLVLLAMGESGIAYGLVTGEAGEASCYLFDPTSKESALLIEGAVPMEATLAGGNLYYLTESDAGLTGTVMCLSIASKKASQLYSAPTGGFAMKFNVSGDLLCVIRGEGEGAVVDIAGLSSGKVLGQVPLELASPFGLCFAGGKLYVGGYSASYDYACQAISLEAYLPVE